MAHQLHRPPAEERHGVRYKAAHIGTPREAGLQGIKEEGSAEFALNGHQSMTLLTNTLCNAMPEW